MKNTIAAVVVLLLLAGAFWGGMIYAEAAGDPVAGGQGGQESPGGGFGGGPGSLTEEQRAEMQGMTQEERQAFMEEQFGDELPATGAGAPGRADRGGLIEGEVIEVSDDALTIALTDGGSQIIYIDEGTAVGYAEGVDGIDVGATASVLAFPEADGVTTAQAIVIE